MLTGYGPAREVFTLPATASYFDTFGASAAMGRTFRQEDERLGCAVVLNHKFWRSVLGGDAAVVGRSLVLDQAPCSVLGVMPESFSVYPSQVEAWILLRPGFEPDQDKMNTVMFVRLRPGVTLAQAQAEVQGLYRPLHPDRESRGFVPVVLDLHNEFTFLASRTLRTTLIVVFAAVLFVVLIACLNVANLLLARLSDRQREFAVRAALGSGRGRLVQQILIESLILAAMGTALGVMLAYGAVSYFRRASPIELTVGARVEVNVVVLAFSVGLAVLTVLIFGMIPALRASRVDLTEWLKVAGRGSVRGGHVLARTLIGMELALSFVLLTGAGLLLASALHMGAERLGFRPEGLLTTALRLPQVRYPDGKAQMHVYDQLLSEPGIALTSAVPPYDDGLDVLEIQGRPLGGVVHDVGVDRVSPGYFDVLGVPLFKGRLFDAHDRENSPPVAIVNQALAREYFRDADPIGRQIRVTATKTWITIVGVVGNVKHAQLMEEMSWIETPIFYRPLGQDPIPYIHIVTRNIPADQIRKKVGALDANVPVKDFEPVSTRLAGTLAYPRFRALVLVFFAMGALLLSAIGLHGVLSQLVAQRVPEFGVRRALGAQTHDLLWLVARYGAIPVVAGLAAGVCFTVGFTGVLRSLLYGIEATDPGALAGVTLLLLTSAALAIWLPARRAARVDPMVALRQE